MNKIITEQNKKPNNKKRTTSETHRIEDEKHLELHQFLSRLVSLECFFIMHLKFTRT